MTLNVEAQRIPGPGVLARYLGARVYDKPFLLTELVADGAQLPGIGVEKETVGADITYDLVTGFTLQLALGEDRHTSPGVLGYAQHCDTRHTRGAACRELRKRTRFHDDPIGLVNRFVPNAEDS